MGPTTGATSPQLQPEAAMLESWPSFQEKSEVWVFMYNLFILNVSNLSFFFSKKQFPNKCVLDSAWGPCSFLCLAYINFSWYLRVMIYQNTHHPMTSVITGLLLYTYTNTQIKALI